MPNRRVMEAADEQRRKARPRAKRTYRKYGAQAHELIHQLASSTQDDHDWAFDRLSRMGEFVASELMEALADPTLDPIAADVVSLLGGTGDERASEPVWQFLQANRDDPERVSTAALSLARAERSRGSTAQHGIRRSGYLATPSTTISSAAPTPRGSITE